MAKRISNQITFTEQKKLIEIREMYLATNLNIENLIDSETQPLEGTDGQLWFNTSGGVDDDQRLMEFKDGEWIVCTEQFTSSIQATNAEKPYLWNYEETVYSIGDPEVSSPILIGVFGKGADGKGILYIYNYYGTTKTDSLPSEEEMPENFWKEKFSSIGALSNEKKYLWNYERIIYTDGSEINTEPTIIGVYGDSGEDAVTFHVYSTQGFEFVNSVDAEERIDTIILQLASFKGSDPLVYEENIGPTYTWFWFNPSKEVYTKAEITPESVGEYWVLENEEYVQKILPDNYESGVEYYTLSIESGDEEILTTNERTFEVRVDDNYAFSNLKCVMSYNGNSYEAYVTLTEKVDVYNASIKFFNDTNVFSQTERYMPVYVELYKNNKLEESIRTGGCYIGNSSVNKNTGVITTDYVIPETDMNNDESTLLLYFVCSIEENIATIDEEIETEAMPAIDHEIILGEYDKDKNIWNVIEDSMDYFYVNDINENSTSHVFLIKKEDVNRSRDINISVYTKMKDEVDDDGNVILDDNGNTVQIIDSDSLVAITHAVVTDLNDVIIDAERPNGGYEGQMWLDTTNGVLNVWTDGDWRPSAKQYTGQNAYTRKPDEYHKDDLWIVAKDEAYTDEVKEELEDGTINTYEVNFTEGSIWIATNDSEDGGFNPAHWSDAVPEITALQNNVQKHFTFSENTQTGLKISQKMSNGAERFYVNINSQRMSFCEDTNVEIPKGENTKVDPDPNEVVHIGSGSATIRNILVNDGATIRSNTTVENFFHIVESMESENPAEPIKKNVPGFTWQIEQNGSLSLIRKLGDN